MSNHLNTNLKVGDSIVALTPMGNFKFRPENNQRHIVLVGGGSGITPLFSIIKSVLIKEPNSMVSLIYVNSNRKNTIFFQQLEQWSSQFSSRFHIIYYWSDVMKSEQPKEGFLSRLFKKIDPHSHRINPERIKVILNDLPLTKDIKIEFYLCGPQKLMEMTAATIQEIGFSKELIHKESFYTVTKSKNMSTEAHKIKILLKGKEYEINVPMGQSILFAGLGLGIDMPFSCQIGNCVSCAGKCLAGKVEMLVTNGFTADQLKTGYILTCVGYPKSDNVVIEFD